MRLAVTGVGMVTPVGHTVVQTAASLRAGIVRTVELPIEIVADDEFEEMAVSGCTLAHITDGFQGLARFQRMGHRAMADLQDHADLRKLPAPLWADTALFVCVSPTPYDESGILEELVREELPGRLCPDLPIPAEHRYLVPEGHASVLIALAHAASKIASREVSGAVVIGLESLVTEDALRYFAERGRLKTANAPSGFVPSEAGTALLVESEERVRRRSGVALAYVRAPRTAAEPSHFLSEKPRLGATIAGLMAGAIREVGGVQGVYADLDGETARSMDWGHAVVRVQQESGFALDPLLLPALSLGNTGAASGAIAISAATRSYARGYAPGPNILIASTSEFGSVAAGVVTHPDG